jgi:hypothetical protein
VNSVSTWLTTSLAKIAKPSGRRNPRPAKPQHHGTSRKQRRHVVNDRPKAQQLPGESPCGDFVLAALSASPQSRSS